MISIREAQESDYPQLLDLHAKMELGYEFDPARKDFLVRSAAFDDCRLVACVLGRATVEGYLLLDRYWQSPQERLAITGKLISLSAEALKLFGMDDVSIWLPPKTNCFSRRLKRMGFVEAPWKCFTAKL